MHQERIQRARMIRRNIQNEKKTIINHDRIVSARASTLCCIKYMNKIESALPKNKDLLKRVCDGLSERKDPIKTAGLRA